MIEDTNRCVCCGEIIPEGRQVCPKCEREACQHVWLFDQLVPGKHGKNLIGWKCQRCGRERLETPHDRSILWPEEDA